MTATALVRVAALVSGLALLAGCTGQPGHSTKRTTSSQSTSRVTPPSGRRTAPPPSAMEATLPCDQAIDTGAQPGPLSVVLGVVALPASPHYGALQTARTGESGPLRLFAKTGLLVKPGTSFHVAISASFSKHARIGWGSPGPTSRQIDVAGCTAPGNGWLAFAGGYWVDHPACLPVLVRSHGHQVTVHVGVGTACPGQSPPQSPTES